MQRMIYPIIAIACAAIGATVGAALALLWAQRRIRNIMDYASEDCLVEISYDQGVSQFVGDVYGTLREFVAGLWQYGPLWLGSPLYALRCWLNGSFDGDDECPF